MTFIFIDSIYEKAFEDMKEAKSTKKWGLWLEFEEYAESEPPEEEYCNIQITFPDVVYALNVWTFEFFFQLYNKSVAQYDFVYINGPDLVVERLEREYLEKVVSSMIERGELQDKWLVPTEDDWHLALEEDID